MSACCYVWVWRGAASIPEVVAESFSATAGGSKAAGEVSDAVTRSNLEKQRVSFTPSPTQTIHVQLTEILAEIVLVVVIFDFSAWIRVPTSNSSHRRSSGQKL